MLAASRAPGTGSIRGGRPSWASGPRRAPPIPGGPRRDPAHPWHPAGHRILWVGRGWTASGLRLPAVKSNALFSPEATLLRSRGDTALNPSPPRPRGPPEAGPTTVWDVWGKVVQLCQALPTGGHLCFRRPGLMADSHRSEGTHNPRLGRKHRFFTGTVSGLVDRNCGPTQSQFSARIGSRQCVKCRSRRKEQKL